MASFITERKSTADFLETQSSVGGSFRNDTWVALYKSIFLDSSTSTNNKAGESTSNHFN